MTLKPGQVRNTIACITFIFAIFFVRYYLQLKKKNHINKMLFVFCSILTLSEVFVTGIKEEHWLVLEIWLPGEGIQEFVLGFRN